jgi:hypothetical protein
MVAGINRFICTECVIGQPVFRTDVGNALVANKNGCVAEFARLGAVGMVEGCHAAGTVNQQTWHGYRFKMGLTVQQQKAFHHDNTAIRLAAARIS